MRNENRFFVERKSVSTKEKDNGPSTFLTTATNRSDCYLSFLSYLHDISIIVQLFWCKSVQGLLRGIFRSEEYLSVSLYVQKIFFFSVEIQSVLNNALSEFCRSHTALAQSQVAGTPCVWKFTFWSFLTKTKQDQAFLSHVHGKIWPHSTQFWVMIFFFYLSLFWAPCTEYNFVFSAEVKRVIC